MTESEIASANTPKNALPDDYETLIAMNKAKERELRLQEAEKANEVVSNQSPPPPSAVENIVPVLPEQPVAQYETLPQATQVISTVEEKSDDTPKSEKITSPASDRYKSAISFSLGTDETSKATQTDESVGKPVKLEYYESNETTLEAGTVIPVRLLTGINTDVEGQVMAQVLTDVYDTLAGTNLLIPQGSKIIGTYDRKGVTNGRVPVTFK